MNGNMGIVDNMCKHWLADIGKRFKRGQIKVATKVNEEMLIFYMNLHEFQKYFSYS